MLDPVAPAGRSKQTELQWRTDDEAGQLRTQEGPGGQLRLQEGPCGQLQLRKGPCGQLQLHEGPSTSSAELNFVKIVLQICPVFSQISKE